MFQPRLSYSFFTHTSLFILLIILATQTVTGQASGGVLKGKIIESSSAKPVPYATVVIYHIQQERMIAGTSANQDGTFEVIVESTDIRLEASFMGFQPLIVSDITFANGIADLGILQLEANSELLEDAVIEAEKSITEFKLDKRVFNVGKDLSSTGASALEVLNNVPSVNVSIEGDISLRGSTGVQILINGKPSVLASEGGNALGTITADMIEKIEVITNPSAKYEAEGTSGILNIVLKKEERKGLNGSISVNTGVPHNHSVGVSLNRRTEKLNLFTQLGAGYRELPNDLKNINQDLISNEIVLSEGREYRNEEFYNFILGTDYIINPANVLTLSGSFALELEDQPSRTDFSFLEASGDATSEWYRTETTTAINPKYQYELQYKSDFPDHKEHDLLFSTLGNFFGKDLESEFLDVTLSGEDVNNEQQTRTSFQEARYTFKLDYTDPITETITLETGAQYVLQDVSNDFAVSDLVDNVWVPDSSFTNVFDYNQNVLGVYGTGAYEAEKWGVKLGLRAENTDLKTLLVNTGQSNNQNFTNLFPSFHSSYKLTKRFSLQLGYSRRIFRPRLWDLNPFFNIRNTFSIRTGNPDLLPEFTDSYEFACIYILDKASINTSLFHRLTTDVVERVSRFEENVTTTIPENIGTNKTTGIEFNAKYEPIEKVTLLGEFGFNYFDRRGEFDDRNFDFTATRWNTEATAKIKFPAQFDFEVSGEYQSGFLTIQGEQSPQAFMNLGVRKKIGSGKAVINFSVRDVFASRIRESETFQPNFYNYSRRFRGRFITLGFSYGFGKGEAMEFSGSRQR